MGYLSPCIIDVKKIKFEVVFFSSYVLIGCLISIYISILGKFQGDLIKNMYTVLMKHDHDDKGHISEQLLSCKNDIMSKLSYWTTATTLFNF